MSDSVITLADLKEVADLPQWAQDEIKEVREEAAKYRTEKSSAVEAAKAEVESSWKVKVEELEGQLSATTQQIDSERTEVTKLKAALEAGIESEKVLSFASLLKGDTEDELKNHADEVKQLFASSEPTTPTRTPAVDPTQGSGNPLPLNGDPLLDSIKKVVGIR